MIRSWEGKKSKFHFVRKKAGCCGDWERKQGVVGSGEKKQGAVGSWESSEMESLQKFYFCAELQWAV